VESDTEHPVAPECAEAIDRIEAAQESDVVERALSAAREELEMGAAYIATVDSEEQTIEAMVGRTNSDVLVPGAVIPVDQTYWPAKRFSAAQPDA
jgi:hypothetical protein